MEPAEFHSPHFTLARLLQTSPRRPITYVTGARVTLLIFNVAFTAAELQAPRARGALQRLQGLWDAYG